jgi:hypothetical protein
MQVGVDLALLLEQAISRCARLDLNCDFQVCFGVESLKYFRKCPLTNLANDREVLAYFLQHM